MTRPALLALAALAACSSADEAGPGLPDLSGLVWVSDSLFLAVHDSKLPDEAARPRVSLLWPGGAGGSRWRSLEVRWPESGPSSDLESAARIPGTRTILLAESGDDGGPFRRIFPATLEGDRLRVAEPVPWPAEVVNVEGTAVARAGEGLLFLYAERSHGSATTRIRWAPLQAAPLAFGAFREAVFALPPGSGMNRPVSALEVDAEGSIYVASAFDPDVDDGPYLGTVWRVGRVAGATVELDSVPRLIARADGIKIESLAVRELPGGERQLVIGSDDENLGAVIRPLPAGAVARGARR